MQTRRSPARWAWSASSAQSATQPPVIFIYLIALLSANLAVVNALPLPPLDGGRVAVSLIQAALGNRVSVAFERYVYLAGFVFLMALLGVGHSLRYGHTPEDVTSSQRR